MIPHRLIRTVPAETSDEVEAWWAKACAMHPGWDHITYRDPLDPAEFPLTSPHWSRCSSGAQLAGLIRLEAVLRLGGIYLDSDVEVYRDLTPLSFSPLVAAWEDADTVPDAVFGAHPGHPAVALMLDEALRRLQSGSTDWRTGSGAWSTGPGVFTALLPGRPDVLLLPPGSFYPYHHSERRRRDEDHATAQPWAFAVHHWSASWLPPDRRT